MKKKEWTCVVCKKKFINYLGLTCSDECSQVLSKALVVYAVSSLVVDLVKKLD